MEWWSVGHNMGPGWGDLFLERDGVPRDAAKLAYSHLLCDMLPQAVASRRSGSR